MKINFWATIVKINTHLFLLPNHRIDLLLYIYGFQHCWWPLSLNLLIFMLYIKKITNVTFLIWNLINFSLSSNIKWLNLSIKADYEQYTDLKHDFDARNVILSDVRASRKGKIKRKGGTIIIILDSSIVLNFDLIL